MAAGRGVHETTAASGSPFPTPGGSAFDDSSAGPPFYQWSKQSDVARRRHRDVCGFLGRGAVGAPLSEVSPMTTCDRYPDCQCGADPEHCQRAVDIHEQRRHNALMAQAAQGRPRETSLPREPTSRGRNGGCDGG